MSKHNVSRAAQLYSGLAGIPGYDAGRLGIEWTPMYRWRPVGSATLTFSAALAAGADGATLEADWSGETGLYQVLLSSGQTVSAFLTNGAETCPFYPAQPSPVGGTYGAASTPQNPNAPQIAGILAAATATATVLGLGPALHVANGYCASQSVGAGDDAVINGALANTTYSYQGATVTAGIPDVPRNVVAAWTTASTITVTGLDIYGELQTEALSTAAGSTGKKAFAVILSIESSAAITGLTVGTGSVLGLPFRVSSGDFFTPMFNDAADAGTFAAADLTLPATSTTGDSRGTYAPAGTLNGYNYLSALIKVTDNQSQVGSFGVTPA